MDIPSLAGAMPDGSSWPRISIVTPSFNQGPFIEETIRSVLLQGYPNLEYIVMDGGSTDGTVEIIKKYEPYLSHLRIGPDGGQSAAIAEGFDRATGDILAWLNSDDRYRPGAFIRIAQFFSRHPKVGFGNGDVNYVDAQGAFRARIYAIRPNSFLTANIGQHGWPQQGCFWRRSAYLQAGGMDQSLRFCMDRDLFIRLTMLVSSKRIPGPPLADFREHSTAKSSTMLDVARAEGNALIAKYSSPQLRRAQNLLQLLWSLWCKPRSIRARLYRIYGIEL